MPARLVPGIEITGDDARALVIMHRTDDLLDLPRERGGGYEVDGVNIKHQQGLTGERIGGDEERFRRCDEGFAVDFGAGRRLETEASRAHARAVTSDAIAERRRKVQERGRAQSKDASPDRR